MGAKYNKASILKEVCLMVKKAHILGGVLLALLLFVVVLMTYGPREVHLTVADNGSMIELKEGQVVSITLEANPTTGYTWEIVEPLNEHVMRQVGEIEFKPESEAIGAGGVQIIRLEVVNAGQTALKLVYHRPWETDVEPLETFSLQVVAR
jgi:inhibitor of cysteine peptidase